jgi:hypothetical protein
LALWPLWALAAFQSPDLLTIGGTPWPSDQLVARPLSKHRAAQTEDKQIYTPNIHALCEIRTLDPSVRASEDSSCLRPFGYCDRHMSMYTDQKCCLLSYNAVYCVEIKPKFWRYVFPPFSESKNKPTNRPGYSRFKHSLMPYFYMTHSSTLKMTAICFSETSVEFLWAIRRYIAEDRKLLYEEINFRVNCE